MLFLFFISAFFPFGYVNAWVFAKLHSLSEPNVAAAFMYYDFSLNVHHRPIFATQPSMTFLC